MSWRLRRPPVSQVRCFCATDIVRGSLNGSEMHQAGAGAGVVGVVGCSSGSTSNISASTSSCRCCFLYQLPPGVIDGLLDEKKTETRQKVTLRHPLVFIRIFRCENQTKQGVPPPKKKTEGQERRSVGCLLVWGR